jgi:hypothetical protein
MFFNVTSKIMYQPREQFDYFSATLILKLQAWSQGGGSGSSSIIKCINFIHKYQNKTFLFIRRVICRDGDTYVLAIQRWQLATSIEDQPVLSHYPLPGWDIRVQRNVQKFIRQPMEETNVTNTHMQSKEYSNFVK